MMTENEKNPATKWLPSVKSVTISVPLLPWEIKAIKNEVIKVGFVEIKKEGEKMELKKCPFCGGNIVVGRGIDSQVTSINCRKCKVKVRWDIPMAKDATFAEHELKWAKKWNRREGA